MTVRTSVASHDLTARRPSGGARDRSLTRSRLLVALFAAGLLMWAAPAPAEAQEVQYKKTTEYSFEDDTIEGDLTRPDGEYVEARKRVRHSNLIRIRESFRDEILQSVGEL